MRITSVSTWKQVVLSVVVLLVGVSQPEPANGFESVFRPPDADSLSDYFGESWQDLVPRHPLAGSDECCSDPGKAAECWILDAKRDGAWCDRDNDCLSNSCDTDENLCTCDDDGDCNDGAGYQGMCNTATHLCGPSYCNGVLICSCWGGCVEQDLGPYGNPEEMCEDMGSGYPGVCCEGTYPDVPEGELTGFCSDDPVCGSGCTDDAECNDNNPCTTDTCFNGGCVKLNQPNGTDCSGVYALPSGRSDDCNSWTCAEGFCALNSVNDGASCADNAESPEATWHADCYYNTCGSGVCEIHQQANGTSCDDGNECSVGTCDTGSECVAAALPAPAGDCCRSDNASTYDDSNECTSDSCDATFHDVNSDVAAGTACPNDQPHADDACGTWACGGGASSGTCIETRFSGDACDSSVPDGTGGANDSCGEWTCDADGACTEKTAAFVGDTCPGAHGDDTCGRWLCGSGADLGNCVETTYAGSACDLDSGGPGGANTECSYWACLSNGSCSFVHQVAGTTPCTDPGGDTDDVCGTWACNGSGVCTETPQTGARCDEDQPPPDDLGGANSFCLEWLCAADGSCSEESFEGRECDSGSGGPGGANDFCGTWACNAAGACEEAAEADGTPCEWAADGDDCAVRECTGGDCGDYNLAVGDSCSPTGAEDACSDYQCDGSHECSLAGDLFDPGMIAILETCNGGSPGTLSVGGNTSLSTNGDSACADDDEDVSSAGRFGACNDTDYADAVYTYGQITNPDFQLRHVTVDVEVMDSGGYSDVENWDPIVYARTDCSDGDTQISCNDDCDFAGTNLPGGECGTLGSSGAEPAITTGPWPLRDYPDSAQTDLFSTTDTFETSVVVDSKLCLTDPPCPNGGEFRLDLNLDTHENDDCRNTASYTAAPIVEGGTYWKERWRGNTTGYDNFFNSIPTPGPTTQEEKDKDCWVGGDPTSSDPKAAFFGFNLPDGETTMTGESDWDHTYKVYTDHKGIGGLDAVLSFWGAGTDAIGGPTQCQSAVTTKNLSVCGGANYPTERIIRNGDSWREGFVSVSNRTSGDGGDYELNIIRVPRPFVSIAKIYAGNPDTGGCCTPTGFSHQMDMEGYRLDFIPTNDWVKGYAVKSSVPAGGSLDNGWLVDPHNAAGKIEHQRLCEGLGCAGNLNGVPQRSLGFALPMGGDFYEYYCVNAAGYVSLRKLNTDSCQTYDPDADIQKLSVPYWDGGYGPMLAPLWGNLIPCYGADTVNYWYEYYGWRYIKVWDGNACVSSRNGEIFSQLTVFEGTTARVVSFDGFQGDTKPSSGLSRSNSLQFQVVIRVDGRVSYFFKAPSSADAWDSILEYAGWVIGMSGTRYSACESDDDCDGLGGTNIYCDATSYKAGTLDVYTASKYCVNRVYDYTDQAEVGGTWQGGP